MDKVALLGDGQIGRGRTPKQRLHQGGGRLDEQVLLQAPQGWKQARSGEVPVGSAKLIEVLHEAFVVEGLVALQVLGPTTKTLMP